jgi:hypothetical protein
MDHPTCGGYCFRQPVLVQQKENQGAGTCQPHICTDTTSRSFTATSSSSSSSGTSAGSAYVLGYPQPELGLQDHLILMKIYEIHKI